MLVTEQRAGGRAGKGERAGRQSLLAAETARQVPFALHHVLTPAQAQHQVKGAIAFDAVVS